MGSIWAPFWQQFGIILELFSIPGASFGKRALRHEKVRKPKMFIIVGSLLFVVFSIFLCLAGGAGASAHLENQ